MLVKFLNNSNLLMVKKNQHKIMHQQPYIYFKYIFTSSQTNLSECMYVCWPSAGLQFIKLL